jgi:endonuclease/exonuclease/phosphatase (EEP) superfamily protein YafD
VAALTLPFGLLATALRVFPPREDAPALLASFIPYAVIAYGLALLALSVATLRARRRAALVVSASVCAGLLALHLSWLVPLFVADDRPASTDTFALMILNTLAGEADGAQIVDAAAAADIVVLVEMTPAAARRLEDRGWRDRFPYVSGDPATEGSGTAIYSRFPLRDPEMLPRTSFQQWSATAAVPGLGPTRIFAVHPCNPFCGGNQWAAEHDLLRLSVAAVSDLPVVVAGDLNAVEDHAPLQALRRDGLRSATDLAGAGWLPTYPAGLALPALLPIDQVLVNDRLTATSARTFAVDGTDHRGLITTLAGSR